MEIIIQLNKYTMFFIVTALTSSILYSLDSIYGKMALDDMPMYVFIFILSFCYLAIAIGMYVYNPGLLHDYLTQKNKSKYIFYAVLAIILGTIIADIFLWYSIKLSDKAYLPFTFALVHTAPIFALIFVYFFFGNLLNWKAILGIIITVVGIMITIIFSGENAENIA